MRYWNDWKPEELPRCSRKAEYSAGVSVESTSQDWLSCAMMRATRASILKAGCRSSPRTRSRAAAQLVDRELHPQLGGLMLHDEQHLVVVARARLLRAQHLVQAQVVAVAHGLAEVEARAVGAVGRRHGARSGAAGRLV